MRGKDPRAESVKKLFVASQTWWGPPVLTFRGRILDGRARLRAWQELRFAHAPPSYDAPTSRDAARVLFFAQHFDRILTDFPELDLTADNVAQVLRIEESDASILRAVLRRGRYAPRAVQQRRCHPQRRDALTQILKLVARAIEDGQQTVPVSDLKRSLRAWL
jgi:hypothetical protein